jgi:RimJ/RimL family protein N-acetyltransferase
VDPAFRPVEVEDLEMVGSWLRAPHVAAWWRDPSTQADVLAKYLPRIRGDEPTEVSVIVVDGQDVGLIQRYRTADYPLWDRHLRMTGIAPHPAAGIDYFIGEADLVGRGIGSEAIRAFSALIFKDWAEVEAVVACPQEANRASCRALERAGYALAWTGDLGSDDPSDEGPSAVYVLRRAGHV